MQPSTWNDENQHWIPQFLLKGFGTKGRAEYVYELNVVTRNIKERNIEQIASTQRLLTDKDDDLLKKIERRASTAIGSIRKGNVAIGPKGRKALDEFVFALLANDPHGVLDTEKVRKEVVETYSAELVSAISRWGGQVNQESVEDYLNRGINHDYLNMLLVNPSKSLALECLHKMELQVHKAVDGEFLAIGDSPVLVVRRDYNGTASLGNPGTQIILPIQSRLLIAYTWLVPINTRAFGPELDRQQVRSLNQDYFQLSKSQNIYGRDIETLEWAQQVQLEWTEKERPVKVSDGWVAMQQFLSAMEIAQMNEEAKRSRIQELWAGVLVEKARMDGQDFGAAR